jgi:hypothetical protein
MCVCFFEHGMIIRLDISWQQRCMLYAVACPVSACHFHILVFSLAYQAPVIVLLASPIFQFYAVKK